MPDELLVERIWYGAGFGPALGRSALAPLSWTFDAGNSFGVIGPAWPVAMVVVHAMLSGKPN